ncbi:MAG: EAL domain-containing protein [Planctomycetes bacterium]|nr:EAL domain-containing protein [Planctomycetota bacterium]
MSIRIKLILSISTIIFIIDALCCMSFFFYSKQRCNEELKHLGMTLAGLFATDSEIKYALDYEQPLLLASPVRRIKEFDRENIVSHIRISNNRNTLFEYKSPWSNIETEEIPVIDYRDYPSEPNHKVVIISGKKFYNYFIIILERQIFSGEALAEQMLNEGPTDKENAAKGFVQILLSTDNLEEKIHQAVLYSIMPVGIGIVLGGLSITLLLTRYIVSPLQHLTKVTQDIAGGNLDRKAHIFHRDEIGQLCVNFNQMTDALRKSHDSLTSEIMSHKRAKAQLLKLSQAVEQSPSAIAITDTTGIIEHINPKFTDLTGYTWEEVSEKKLFNLVLCTMPSEKYENIIHTVLSGKIWRMELVNNRKDGEHFYAYITISAVRSDDGDITHFVGIIEDSTGRKRTEEKLVIMADHDPLTNLYNRRRFQKELAYWLEYSKRHNSNGTLMFLDLDNFKDINDTLGHKTGDEILINFASLLKERLRASDILARLGGDEFAIIMPNTNAVHAQSYATQILQMVRKHFSMFKGQGHTITASIGIALFPEHSTEADILLTYADLAMYGAKEGGKNQCCIFSPEQKQNVESRLLWDKRIRCALEDNHYALHLQPIVNLNSNTVFGYEVLLRMIGEKGELIKPAEFLPFAEKHGSILDVDRWVIRNSFQLFNRYNLGKRETSLEINLSGRSITDSGLLSFIKEELSASNIDARYIIFEITESALVENINDAQYFIDNLARAGLRFALDDFGIGFCSFAYLKHLQVDFLKIDGSFIRNMFDNPVDQYFVKAIADVSRGLGKHVVAEFVENSQVIPLLQEFGIHYGQGYYFGKARAASEIFND